jgi:hypothetical protein
MVHGQFWMGSTTYQLGKDALIKGPLLLATGKVFLIVFLQALVVGLPFLLTVLSELADPRTRGGIREGKTIERVRGSIDFACLPFPKRCPSLVRNCSLSDINFTPPILEHSVQDPERTPTLEGRGQNHNNNIEREYTYRSMAQRVTLRPSFKQ